MPLNVFVGKVEGDLRTTVNVSSADGGARPLAAPDPPRCTNVSAMRPPYRTRPRYRAVLVRPVRSYLGCTAQNVGQIASGKIVDLATVTVAPVIRAHRR